MKIAVEVKDVSGKIFLREHIGSGEGSGVKFNLSRGLGMPALFIEVDDGTTLAVELTLDHVADILTAYGYGGAES